jgi:hypothetical protein
MLRAKRDLANQPKPSRFFGKAIRHRRHGSLPKQPDTMEQCDSVFAQKPTDLVGQCRARLDQASACTM